MKVKVWIISWFAIVITILSTLGYWVYKIDPYFHYHEPDVERYFYTLNNQRSQNDGISKHFDYDALISGTSMTENFRTTEADRIFGCRSIKVSYSGGSYKEINDNIERALKANSELKTVIRCLDMVRFYDSWDFIRLDMGDYPAYLYDNNLFNDVEYLFNRDIIFGRAYQMTLEKNNQGFKSGITSFDDYSRWQESYVFGINTVSPNGIIVNKSERDVHLSDEEKEIIRKNIELNVTSVADEYPNVEFYYFYSPYSIAWWCDIYSHGTLCKQIEAEKYITELIIPHKNIHLYSFNNRTDIITDLNNYKDAHHYACWVNSLILKWMHDGNYQLTEDNYIDYLIEEYSFYSSFDYASINGQVDYEADFYAAALLNNELKETAPLDVLNSGEVNVTLNGADYIKQDNKNVAIECHGSLARDSSEELTAYLRNKEYIGARFEVNLDEGYSYLSFSGQKIKDHGQLTVYVYNEDGEVVGKVEANYPDLDSEIHQYVIDLSAVSGNVTIVLNGGYIDNTGSVESNYLFSSIYMY